MGNQDKSREQSYAGVFDNRLGFGKKCAVIVIDFMKAYTTPGEPLYHQGIVDAVDASVSLIETARATSTPIIHARVMYDRSGVDGGIFVKKIPVLRTMVEGEPMAEIDPKMAPLPGEHVIVKNYASAFFGTSLASALTALGVDTVILIGCSTSGCVRATAVDAIQSGFIPIVPEECVGDRHAGPHDAAMFDMNAKYADVMPKSEVEAHLKSTAH